jgi:Resolvase, N terminal domain
MVLPTLYDDGGYSGGTMERPALKRLIADIEASEIDVVVVYSSGLPGLRLTSPRPSLTAEGRPSHRPGIDAFDAAAAGQLGRTAKAPGLSLRTNTMSFSASGAVAWRAVQRAATQNHRVINFANLAER